MSQSPSPYSFTVVYFLEILKVLSVGMMTLATANHLLLELHYSAAISSLITGLYSAGFMVFALGLGWLADRWGQVKVLRFAAILSIVFGALSVIQITNTFRLVLFALWRFGDGAANGLFWPTVQKFSIYAERYGVKAKKDFIAGYNFSWNFGALSSLVLGSLMVYSTNSNYLVFFINLIGASLAIVMTFVGLKPMPEMPDGGSVETILPSKDEKELPLRAVPMSSLIMGLLIHSLTDGAISILLPLRVGQLAIGSYWVFLLSLSKSLVQTVTTTFMAHLKDQWVLKWFRVVLFAVPCIWIPFLFVYRLDFLLLMTMLSGFAQGTIYALGMGLMAVKAQEQKSARPYTYFQATMSGGRMSGPWIIGLGSNFSLYLGLIVIIIYAFCAGGIFLGTTRKPMPSPGYP